MSGQIAIEHVHSFDKLTKVKEPLRRYVQENGKPVADIMTGFDMLKQRRCSCGAVQTYDLERTVV